MAKIAEYKFTDYNGYDAAYKRLSSEVGSDCLQYESAGGHYYIYIYDNCSDPRTAGQICNANGGEAV